MPSTARAIALVAFLLSMSVRAQPGQRTVEPRLFGGVGIGFHLPKLDTTSLDNAQAIPGAGLLFELGTSFTHHDRIGLALHGTFGLNSYGYWVDTVCYYRRHITQRLEARLFYQVPNPFHWSDFLQIGLGAGYTYQQRYTMGAQEEQFTVISSAADRTIPYLAPEIAFAEKEVLHRVELGLRYVVHLDRTPALVNTASSAQGGARFTATNDQVVAVVRYHFGLPKKPSVPSPPPALDLAERRTDTLTTLATTRDRITLWLWDNAEYDGDTISVLLNGMPLLTGHELTDRRFKLRIDLPPGASQLLIVAHNEGRVPPNTASGLVRYGKGRRELLIRTSLKSNQLVVVERR